MIGGNSPFNPNGWPPLFFNVQSEDDVNMKLNHDSYRVYVNGDYVGDKVLLAPNENINDIKGYLRDQGFNGFTANQDGDYLLIDADDEEARHIRDNLNIYLRIR